MIVKGDPPTRGVRGTRVSAERRARYGISIGRISEDFRAFARTCDVVVSRGRRGELFVEHAHREKALTCVRPIVRCGAFTGIVRGAC